MDDGVVRGGPGKVWIVEARDDIIETHHGYDDTPENLRRFLGTLTPDSLRPDGDGFMWVSAALVPHPENDYDPNAVSVSAPAAPGVSLAQRHLAYLSTRHIHAIGRDTIPQLAEVGGGQVLVTAAVWVDDEHREDPSIHLAVPPGRTLQQDAREFLLNLDEREGHSPRPHPDAHRTHTGASELLQRVHDLVSHFPKMEPATFDGVVVSPVERTGTSTRQFAVATSGDGRYLGLVTSGVLVCTDERERPAVLGALARRGLNVREPVHPALLDPTSSWVHRPVNGRIRFRRGALDLRPASSAPDDDITFAIFNPATRKLWVEDSRLLEPALSYAASLGLDVRSYGMPKRPWNLDDEVPFYELSDRSAPRPENGLGSPLLLPLKDRVPAGVFADEVAWRDGYQGSHPEADTVLVEQERDCPARAILLPWATITDHLGPCRLCGCPALAVTAPELSEPTHYCSVCLRESVSGLVKDRARAALALAALSADEFDGQALTEDQIETVQPPAYRSPAHLDRALLLRMGIQREALPWTVLLVTSGLADAGVRTSRGTVIAALDGHLCLSLSERRVCDFLHRHGVEHTREPLYPQHGVLNPLGRRRADWLLADGTLVEFWGMPNDPGYARKMADKRELAAAFGIALLELLPADLTSLVDVFSAWLPRT